jgi:chromosome segregation ATPase
MRKLLCSLAIVLLLVAALAVQADQPSAANEPSKAEVVSPPAVTAPDPAPMPSADVATTEMKKLKYQIKTVRLSLADTHGRLAVTEKELSTATRENGQLRSENTNLRVGLAKAETVARKSEEELAYRRQEAKTLQARPSSGSGALAVGLLLSLVVTGLLALVLFGQGDKLRAALNRVHGGKADEKRQDQLSAQLKEEQQRSHRLEEEIQRLRAAAESQSNAPAGSKKEKLDCMRRELREARAAAEAEKRQADERIQRLETELARIVADKQEVTEHAQKLEPAVARLTAEKLEVEERIQVLEPEVARLTVEKLRLERAVAKAHQKLIFLGHDEPEDTLPPIVG